MSSDESAPFEGPEKLLEIWFAPGTAGDAGLLSVQRSVWEDMLDIVKCKVLSVLNGDAMDAYLLSESSLFISPHRLILKTCGTTLNLLGLPRVLDIAATAGMGPVHKLFYSRKAFMFPDRQLGVHREWKYEVEYLDKIFAESKGAAYTVGKVNGDHWLLYMLSNGLDQAKPERDCTIEILMSDLSPTARSHFTNEASEEPHKHAKTLSSRIGITDIFGAEAAQLDAYSFSPCGYSANALIPARSGGYYTIHVTPEEGWSYASFECNVVGFAADLEDLIKRVVRIFEPGRLTMTLFVSEGEGDGDEVVGAQKAFRNALKLYKRTDKINYEFGGYDLAFASFEKL